MPESVVLKEFSRLYQETNEVSRSHEEFLKLIYITVVKLHTGEWKAPDE